jgi:mono/diheme cytochrome c family protein
VTSVASADPYLDVVQPLLEQRCGTCHNDDKRNGGFSVAGYEATLVGGDTGRAFVPGSLEASEALYRTSLPPDDEAFMPAEGKTPLTAEQVAILRWWVAAGAPRNTTVGTIGVPADVETLLAAQLGLALAQPPSVIGGG